MNSSIFKLDWKDLLSSTISAVLAAILAYLATVTDLTQINLQGIAVIAIGAAAASLLKSFATDDQGKLLGALPIKSSC